MNPGTPGISTNSSSTIMMTIKPGYRAWVLRASLAVLLVLPGPSLLYPGTGTCIYEAVRIGPGPPGWAIPTIPGCKFAGATVHVYGDAFVPDSP
eukprot:178192-Rhodomonas_salina.1